MTIRYQKFSSSNPSSNRIQSNFSSLFERKVICLREKMLSKIFFTSLFHKSILESGPKLFLHVHSDSKPFKGKQFSFAKKCYQRFSSAISQIHFRIGSKATSLFPHPFEFELYQKFSSPISQIPDRIQSNFSFSMSTQIRILRLFSPISQISDPR